ncbi:hypothetical protein JHK84_049472 [Glycine max]|nr:hypothetical protein JHK85_050197 [Glycine max]KAG5093884.1 hypothetical protein JHK84_049472 [Glycine max]
MAQDLCLQNCVMETGFLPLAQAWVNKSKRPTTLFDAILQDCKSINKESANAKVLFVKKQVSPPAVACRPLRVFSPSPMISIVSQSSKCLQVDSSLASDKALELDAALGSCSVQYREIQGQESQKFLSYFRPCLIPIEGVFTSKQGNLNGEYHVSLYTCKGDYVVYVKEQGPLKGFQLPQELVTPSTLIQNLLTWMAPLPAQCFHLCQYSDFYPSKANSSFPFSTLFPPVSSS